MRFLSENNDIILHEDEEITFLKEILNEDKWRRILKIRRYDPTVPDWIQLITELQLEHGLDFKQDGPSQAPKKAFKIIKYESLPIKDKPNPEEDSIEITSKLDRILVKNRLIKANIDLNFL